MAIKNRIKIIFFKTLLFKIPQAKLINYFSKHYNFCKKSIEFVLNSQVLEKQINTSKINIVLLLESREIIKIQIYLNNYLKGLCFLVGLFEQGFETRARKSLNFCPQYLQ